VSGNDGLGGQNQPIVTYSPPDGPVGASVAIAGANWHGHKRDAASLRVRGVERDAAPVGQDGAFAFAPFVVAESDVDAGGGLRFVRFSVWVGREAFDYVWFVTG
jgi:hypothetical protein